ncbi:RHS repeat-associated core domain-containing protein [Snodgrassella sp. M0110]|uniref:RHS repeat-associated core domain-containing protein n=2 Tax=Snodgrassella TaxID=1193515 RepID=UPI0018DBACEE|nr:RHS repeat-associated core domain-containing protein [Snodgrassella sp. M0110]MBI0067478.1 RHS repeat protein [Snodgrassella sp. M0110]
MGEAYWAARKGDVLLHTSMLADLVEAAVEIACYAAITAAVSLAILGTVATGGLAAFAIGVVVGVGMGLTGGDKLISGLAEKVSSIFPLSEDGKIKTGSQNTRTNSLPSARAAGIVKPAQEIANNEQPQQPESFIDTAGNILKGIGKTLKQMVRPTVASPDPNTTEPRDDDKISCKKHPSSFSDIGMPSSPALGVLELGISVTTAAIGSITGAAEYMAEGSKKVYINSQPAVRSNDRSTCEAKVTEDCEGSVKVSNNVRIGGESVVVREIKSGKHPIGLILSVIMAARRPGKICTKIFCFATDSMIGAGSSMITTALINAIKAGHPVHIPTGAKILDGSEELDFSLPAHLPFEWQRFYNSVDTRTHNMFGAGWSVGYEIEMEIDPQPDGSCSAIYTDEQGRQLEIEALLPNHGMRGINENLTIRRGEQDRWVIEDDDGLYRLFEPDPNNPRRLLLSMLQDRNDNQLLIYRDSRSRIVEIADNDNAARISLHYQDQRHPQRVTEIRQELSDGSNRLLNRYQYNEQGDLQQVFDAENRQTREFAYNSDRRMTYHRLPTGLQCYYQWSYFSTADVETAWRVTRHWSEADGQRLEDYHFHYDLDKRLTTVEDSLGRVSEHYWNEIYQITRYTDALGQTTEFEWNDNQQLVSATDPQGGQWHYSYDEQGRLTEETDPLGRTTQTQWLPHWALPTISVDPDGSSWRYYYDERGNLLTVTDPLQQHTHYQYDRHGQVVCITDVRGGNKHLRWNENGQLIQHVDCSGSITHFYYNTAGNLTSITNAIGNSSKYQYNAAGQLIGATLADGRQEHYNVNAAGQLQSYTDPAGHTTRYRRDQRGLVHTRIDAAGRQLGFSYDAYGRLTALTNENGEQYRFQYDAGDRLIEQTDLDGRRQQLSYDPLDNVSSVRFAAGSPHQIEHRFKRDAVGRLIGKYTPDGTTAYQYDKVDNLLKVGFKAAGLPPEAEPELISFSYDIMGNLLSETTAQGVLQHQYDKLGNRIATTLPDGRTINKLYYGSGHLHQINLDGQIISDIERDHLHRETLRSQGRMNTSFQYDRTGRLTGKQTSRPGAGILPDTILDRSYSYDNLDRLVSKKHNRQGQSDYRYDVTGRIESCRNEAYWETLQYDAAANLLDRRRGEEESNQNLIRFNQLLSFRGLKYSYDEHGRTRSKQTASGTQYYHYDAEHRLTEVRIEQLNHTERYGYVYDALGRRIEKHRLDRDSKPCNRTTFLWDGLQMIQESSADKRQSLYLYTDQYSYEPLARIDRNGNQEQHIYYFHTDLNGMPEELTDEAGEIVWECSYQLWGKPIQESAHREIQQNLRYQGQYLDRETGLHYNTFRYYDPDIGRFTQPDPIGLAGGYNLYRYAPNALIWIDPLGLHETLSDNDIVCRGGTCKAENFKNGSGVKTDANGKLREVSTQAKPGADLETLAKAFNHNQVGIATVGEIEKAGGTIILDGKSNVGGPHKMNHATVEGLTAEQLEQLFTPTQKNPAKKTSTCP